MEPIVLFPSSYTPSFSPSPHEPMSPRDHKFKPDRDSAQLGSPSYHHYLWTVTYRGDQNNIYFTLLRKSVGCNSYYYYWVFGYVMAFGLPLSLRYKQTYQCATIPQVQWPEMGMISTLKRFYRVTKNIKKNLCLKMCRYSAWNSVHDLNMLHTLVEQVLACT